MVCGPGPLLSWLAAFVLYEQRDSLHSTPTSELFLHSLRAQLFCQLHELREDSLVWSLQQLEQPLVEATSTSNFASLQPMAAGSGQTWTPHIDVGRRTHRHSSQYFGRSRNACRRMART